MWLREFLNSLYPLLFKYIPSHINISYDWKLSSLLLFPSIRLQFLQWSKVADGTDQPSSLDTYAHEKHIKCTQETSLRGNESGNDRRRVKLFHYGYVCGKQITFHGKGLVKRGEEIRRPPDVMITPRAPWRNGERTRNHFKGEPRDVINLICEKAVESCDAFCSIRDVKCRNFTSLISCCININTRDFTVSLVYI